MRRCIQITTFLLVIILLAIPEVKANDSSAVKVDWKPSPAGAAFRSLALPGWGQAYVHKPLKAVIYGGIQHALVFSVFMRGHQYNLEHKYGEESRADFYRNERNRLSWYLAGAILLSTLDAYVDAHLYDFDVSDDLSESHRINKTEDLLFMGVKINFSWRFH